MHKNGVGIMITSLSTTDFRALSGHREFEFPEGIVGLVGPNGIGKSTVINSISWGLYGAEALPLKARDPITWGAKEALVRVGFDLADGTEWTVERSQKPTGLGKAKLFGRNGIKADGSAPTTNAITELMGVDREGFMISVFARQGELDRLRSMEAAPRMQTVLRLLGINQITKAIKTVREEGNQQKKSLDALRGHQIDADAIEEQLRSLDAEFEVTTKEGRSLQDMVEAHRNMVASLTSLRQELEPKRKAYQNYLNELQSRKTTLQLAEVTLRQAEAALLLGEPEKPKEPEYLVQYVVEPSKAEHLKREYLKARDLYISEKAERDGFQTQLNSLTDSCPTCGRPFEDAAHVKRERDRIQKRIKDLDFSLKSTSDYGQAAKEAWDKELALQQESNAVNQKNASREADFRSAIRQYELVMAHRAEAKERFEQATRSHTNAHQALDTLAPVEDVQAAEAELQKSLDTTQLELNRLVQQLAQTEADRKTLAFEIERLHRTLAEEADNIAAAKKIEKEVISHETAASELQKLKETLIGKIIPSLNERASALVEMMTDGKYSELSLTPDYEIEYRNALGDYKNFLNLSGGEQTVFALALRLAISDLRAGNLGVIFLDEAISNLSSEDGRQESVWQAIESLTGRFRQIFVITHVEAYKDRAPFTVRL